MGSSNLLMGFFLETINRGGRIRPIVFVNWYQSRRCFNMSAFVNLLTKMDGPTASVDLD